MNTENTQNEKDAETNPPRVRPIGYWLRVVDGLLTREFAVAFENEGVTRRDWMLLNAVAGDVDAPGLSERLARKGKRLQSLADRGWVEQQGDGSWALTDEGRAEKERLSGIVDGLRERVAGAVSPEEYATTMATLEAVARELGWDESDTGRGFGRFGRRGFGRGFRPGFGPGPFPRDGFGPDERPGFGSPWGPGHGPDAYRGWHSRLHHEHPHVHEGHGHSQEHAHHGRSHAHGHHGQGHHGHGHGRRRAERAYERGFEAGFARGREDERA